MALWNPYAEEALDLTNNSEDVRASEERSVGPTVPDNTYLLKLYEYRPQANPVNNRYHKTPSQPNSPEFYEVDSLADDEEYQAFERDAFQAMVEKNGGTLFRNNPRMRRAVQTTQEADGSHKKQRARNKYAAKKSRERRKLREVRLSCQVTFLKKKIADLRCQLSERVCQRCQQQFRY